MLQMVLIHTTVSPFSTLCQGKNNRTPNFSSKNNKFHQRNVLSKDRRAFVFDR